MTANTPNQPPSSPPPPLPTFSQPSDIRLHPINNNFKDDSPRTSGWLSPQRFVHLLTVFAALGGFLFGYDTGVVSGAMLPLKHEFKLSTIWIEAIVSVTVGAAAVSAVVSGMLNDAFGRRPVILAASAVFTAGAALLGFANNKEELLIGRLILGIGIGFASTTTPMYISEMAPAEVRGRLVVLNTGFLTGGQFIASLVNGAFITVHEGWRFMLGLAAIPGIAQFIGFLFLPESPRWLLSKGREGDARRILGRIRNKTDAENELADILNQQSSKTQDSIWITFKKMLGHSAVRRALVVGCGLQMFQQIGGINTVMYYSATIIKMSGVSSIAMSVWLSAVTAFVNFAFTFVGMAVVDRAGRRKLTLVSMGGVALSLGILAIGFQLNASVAPALIPHTPTHPNASHAITCARQSTCDECVRNEHCGICVNGTQGLCFPLNGVDPVMPYTCNATTEQFLPDYCPSPYAWMSTVGMVVYLMFFAPGMGPMPWTVNAEIYPTWSRSAATGLATSVNWVFNLIVSMTFLTLLEVLTPSGAFWLYSGLAVIGFFFLFFLLPETRGKTLEEIEKLFTEKTRTRIGGQKVIDSVSKDNLIMGHQT